jgi:hydrogenase maturation protease
VKDATVVIGIGNDHRRDDGVGPVVAAAVAAARPGMRVLTCAAEPTAILDAWEGATRAVVIDAARPGDDAVPGRVHRCTLGDLVVTRAVSSHDLNLAQTYGLGRALGRAPAEVVVITVDAADTGHGPGLSSAVETAVPRAVSAVLAVLDDLG